MKRMTFKTVFRDRILSDQKRATSRWKDKGWVVGEVRAAVTPQGRKPAFLTPVKDAFCTLECTNAEAMFWKDFTDEHAKKCGVTREWYLKEKPDVEDLDRIYFYEFKRVVKPFPWEEQPAALSTLKEKR